MWSLSNKLDERLRTCKDFLKLPRVCVRWYDASSGGGWDSLKAYRERNCPACETMGYLLKVTKDSVTIGQTISNSGNLLDSIAIPRGWITSMERFPRKRASRWKGGD